MRKGLPRKKKYMLKVKIFGVNIYVCNLNLKPYLRRSTIAMLPRETNLDGCSTSVGVALANTAARR